MKRRAFTIIELIMITIIAAVLAALAIAFLNAQPRRYGPRKSASAQNNRQIALAAIMYGADYDDTMPITVNGWLSRMQDRGDAQLTVAAPAKGTQSTTAPDAGGGQRTDAWPLLLLPYIKSRGLFVDPGRADTYQIWSSSAKAASDPNYDATGTTYRNQDMFPMYGYNYMFCAPLRIPTSKRTSVNPANYAVSDSHTYVEADDPSGTIFFTESRYAKRDPGHGFFVINAPGMWDAFKNNPHGLVAYWTGGAGGGDWVESETACADSSNPCQHKQSSHGFVDDSYNGGANATFIDGHVKYMKMTALAVGTDYSTATAKADGSGVHITDRMHYLWNLTKDFHGL